MVSFTFLELLTIWKSNYQLANYKPIMNLPQTKKQQTLKMQSLYPQIAVTSRSETLVVSIQS